MNICYIKVELSPIRAKIDSPCGRTEPIHALDIEVNCDGKVVTNTDRYIGNDLVSVLDEMFEVAKRRITRELTETP